MKTDVHLWKRLVKYFLEWEVFQKIFMSYTTSSIHVFVPYFVFGLSSLFFCCGHKHGGA